MSRICFPCDLVDPSQWVVVLTVSTVPEHVSRSPVDSEVSAFV